MNLITTTNNKNLEENVSSEQKVNLNQLNKNQSNNSSSLFIYNQFNKSLVTEVNKKSEVNYKCSISGIKEKNSKMKKHKGINKPITKLIPENIDKIIDDKVKIFEVLENLLIDDDNTHNNTSHEEEKYNSHRKIYDKDIQIEKVNLNKKKKAQSSLEVPILDFSNIFNYYSKKPLHIQEVKYVWDFLEDNNEHNNTNKDSENKNKNKKKKSKSKKHKSKNKK